MGTLTASARSAALVPPPHLSSSSQRFIEGDGTPDDDWQAWPGLATLPAVSAQGLVPPGSRAVIVAPHPDDELLSCGGLMQLLAAQEREMSLIAVTDGSASHPRSTLWPAERLAQERPLETARALQVLDIAGISITRAGLPDGKVTIYEPQLLALLEQQLRPGDVVFATWRLDGHPDHEATGRAAAAAAAMCGASLVEVPIWCWHWAYPGDSRIPWQRAKKLKLAGDVLRCKRDAVACYRSQLEPDVSTGRGAIVPPTALKRLMHPYELFFT